MYVVGVSKDPGIPNSFPLKDQVLKELKEKKEREESRMRQKEARRLQQAKSRSLQGLRNDAERRLGIFEKKVRRGNKILLVCLTIHVVM